MKRKRRHFPPDNRLDWHDPNMPAFEGKFRSPEEITKMAQSRLESSFGPRAERYFPSYKNDPSYWWNEKNNLK